LQEGFNSYNEFKPPVEGANYGGLRLAFLIVILKGVLNKENALPCWRVAKDFIISSLSTASCWRSENNKALMLRIKAFSL